MPFIAMPPPEMTPTIEQMDERAAAGREVWLPLAEVQKACGGNPAPLLNYSGKVRRTYTVLGCEFYGKVYLPNDWPSARETQRIRTHEWAHALYGWKHRAPGF